YRRVRPPGYGGPIAEAAGDPAREGAKRLWRALGAMVACGLSVFCLLVGLGSWLVGSPAPGWFPWETAWQLLLVMAGLALTPLWYKLGFGGEEEE
ncbi:MAG: hypothetical protein O7A69_10440, partial [SAR324 cluster bacterium]|nr:hypothetical protein [SAR324 cluster bacterium]